MANNLLTSITLRERQESNPEHIRKSTVSIKEKLDIVINDYVHMLNQKGVKISKSELYRELMIAHLKAENFLPEDFEYGD